MEFRPRALHVSEATLNGLREAGFEIGVHGLKHDGRDFESLRTFKRRLPEIREQGELWGAVGFRSPSTHRVWEWMECSASLRLVLPGYRPVRAAGGRVL